ncbi:MAG: hypothetical protein DA408_09710 [Bacteroidetes bacterium]|nr:MAG: hypothetical protein C7N36_10660 [Bacteroidota bacterium]PTM12675.1 MAG: hypothetical protein DA408_09710 [Bacteroidota bacterium]
MFAKFTQFLNRLTGGFKHKLEQQVRELLARGEVPAVLQLLIAADYPAASLFKLQWEANQQQFAQKVIDAETFNITNNRIAYALLDMVAPTAAVIPEPPAAIEEEPAETLPVPLTVDQRQQMEALLHDGQWPAALELASNWNTSFLLLFKRFQGLERDLSLGIISQANYERIRKQIKSSMEELIGE